MRVKPTAEVIESLRPVAEEQGVEIVDCEWNMRTRALTLYLDAEGGLDRPFKTERDFLKHLGEKVEVRLYAPFEGKKYYEGELKSYQGETFTVCTAEGEKTIPVKAASKVCLYIEV